MALGLQESSLVAWQHKAHASHAALVHGEGRVRFEITELSELEVNLLSEGGGKLRIPAPQRRLGVASKQPGIIHDGGLIRGTRLFCLTDRPMTHVDHNRRTI